jgi:xanthine dehydrogenase YagR molybdenum-binding subunit
MPAVVGHRAPTIQRIRIGARRDGRIQALAHSVVTCTSTVGYFVEPAALPSRVMYTAPNSRTAHRVTRLDIPAPSWMRAPGECPGMFALESAIDELADICGIDPVELRIRNEPAAEPDSGLPFSSRHLAECLREGARRFGWHARDPRPGARREGRLLTGSGVAASMFPVFVLPSRAEVHADTDGQYRVRVNATDIGTGARTVLAQIAADALTAPLGRVRISVGSTDLPEAPLAGGSSGTASWGWAVHNACVRLHDLIERSGGIVPVGGLSASADTTEDVKSRQEYARYAFGAQFAEVQVDTDTAEVRLRRLTGVFAAGRILNARTARSQFIGGMAMGLSMALMEGSTMDPEFGDHAERDLASYHVAVCADVPEIEAHWIDEDDPHLNPMGSKGIGEIGIVGTAAAIANAVYHATGVRVRQLPIRPDTLLPHFA